MTAKVIAQEIVWHMEPPGIKAVRFGEGPWMKEPDKVEWRSHGLPCLAVRNHAMGAFCGYVAVGAGHPLFEVSYSDERAEGLRAHGGLTFSGRCQERGAESERICHTGDDKVWWFGFDCLHGGDLVPSIEKMDSIFARHLGGTYRDLAYVKAQVEELARQLKEVSAG